MSRRGRDLAVGQGLGSRLLEVLADQRLTQQTLAERLGASPSFVSALVRGLKVPGADFLVALHDALGVSINWLLLGSGRMYGDEVDADLIQTALVQVQLARRATRAKDPEAIALLRSALPRVELPPPFPPPATERLEAYLDALMVANQDLPTAIALVNEALTHAMPEHRLQAIGAGVETLVRAQAAPSILRILKPGAGHETAGPKTEGGWERDSRASKATRETAKLAKASTARRAATPVKRPRGG